jgi:subfamily B ATP-binding cassette protein MsbA
MATTPLAGAKSTGAKAADAKAAEKSAKAPANSRQLSRLIHYVLPYWAPFIASVLLMALVGLLDAFRVLLIGPIFNRVLNPGSQGRTLELFKLPGTDRFFDLQQIIPSHFQNPWTAVAFALVAATVLK